MGFADLKKNRSNSLDKLSAQLKNMDGGNKGNEDYWTLEVDKAGNGYAILRFLPAPDGEDMPFVRLWDHGFQGPGGWYIENSLTTLGKDDPVSEFNSKLWNSGHDEDKDQARKQKRRLSYHANVYIVKDPANPQNEGKVFKFKFGKKIFDKLNDLMNPQFEDETPINPFDLWEGADFKLKARNVEGYRNYDKSEFSDPGAITHPDGSKMSDDEMEAVWKQQFSLAEIVDPKNFKSYEELQGKLYKVLGLNLSDGGSSKKEASQDREEMDFKPNFKEKEATSAPATSSDGDDDDDAMAFFRDLAEG